MSLQIVEKKKIILYGSQGDPILILIEPGLQNGKPVRQEGKFKDWYAKNAMFKNCLYAQACSALMDHFNLDLRCCLSCPIRNQANSRQPFLTEKDEGKLNSINNLSFIKSLTEQGSLRFLPKIENPETLASLNQAESSLSKLSPPSLKNKPDTTPSKNLEEFTTKTEEEKPKRGRGRGLSLFLLKYLNSAGDIQEERIKEKNYRLASWLKKKPKNWGWKLNYGLSKNWGHRKKLIGKNI